MKHQRISALTKQIQELERSYNEIHDRAATAGRDLTETEETEAQTLVDRAAQLKPELEKIQGEVNTMTAVADIARRLGTATPDTPTRDRSLPAPQPLSAGEYFAAYLEAFGQGGTRDVEKFLDRAAPYLDRAVAEMTTADTAGILPVPIVGELIKLADSSRPVFNALTGRPMPQSGKQFTRPRITQRVNVGEQDPELEELVSRKMIVSSDTVTKRTFGGVLRLSQQDIDWTDPAILNILLADFVDYYAEVTEGAACDFLEALPIAADTAADNTGHSPYDDTDVGTLVTSYVNGVVKLYGKAKRMPTHVFHDLASAAALAGTTNTNDDRTALSMIKEALNELGVAMTWVTGPQLAANQRILAAGSLLEAYEQRKGLLQAVVPSVVATDIAYYGYVAFWARHEGVICLDDYPAD